MSISADPTTIEYDLARGIASRVRVTKPSSASFGSEGHAVKLQPNGYYLVRLDNGQFRNYDSLYLRKLYNYHTERQILEFYSID